MSRFIKLTKIDKLHSILINIDTIVDVEDFGDYCEVSYKQVDHLVAVDVIEQLDTIYKMIETIEFLNDKKPLLS